MDQQADYLPPLCVARMLTGLKSAEYEYDTWDPDVSEIDRSSLLKIAIKGLMLNLTTFFPRDVEEDSLSEFFGLRTFKRVIEYAVDRSTEFKQMIDIVGRHVCTSGQ